MLAVDVERPTTEREAELRTGPSHLEKMILEDLLTAGIQGTVRKEGLKFDRPESYAGTWIQPSGEDSDGNNARRAAVCIGPEHGTVGPEPVKEAAKEAVLRAGFDVLVVAGFPFDPHVSEQTKRSGNQAVLSARIGSDLRMGDGLLKKTNAAQARTAREPAGLVGAAGRRLVPAGAAPPTSGR